MKYGEEWGQVCKYVMLTYIKFLNVIYQIIDYHPSKSSGTPFI